MLASVLSLLALTGCTKIPEGLQPVQGFILERFLGTWYEIARLDHGFERGLDNVTAEFIADGEDGFKLVNRGYRAKSGEWKEETGQGSFVGDNNVGSLKVSYFGPFYGGYHIVDLDRDNYRYAMVAGPSRSILWILSRDKTMDDKTYSAMVAKAIHWGFDIKKLILVNQNPPAPAAATPAPAEK
ncbi:lipocalin [Candidatus Methylospira mobilis]|uniref:Outer membrane lipoprotein Blc n=1 Tax=Candidatus Methylospira mobilis TaxID=1808979 RepID=A0A5Q0BCY4_9GAMM|nr:lipocalin family protein [Candidatus Methylospira mobilis]QFY41773.1 lipocalin [Candidatus Methylospira mobilis]WNV06635.1 lipocalin family protein [Candidatus Methylospira mobilis]